MNQLASYIERLNHLPVDLRAEVVVADMLDDGLLPDDLILNPVGAFKRAFGRDISRVDWIEATHKSQQWLRIDLNRAGLYDLLPEGVFHQPTTNEALADKEDTLREMAIQHEREGTARRFFLPFEQEFFRQRIQIEREQRAFLFGVDSGQPNNLLDWFWNLPDFLTRTQIKRLLYLLPVIHQMAGNPTAMEACFGQLIDERVALHDDGPTGDYVQTNTPGLGQWELGDDSVFDGWLYDGEPVLRVVVYIDRADRLTEYLPGGNGQQLITWLARYLIPLDAGIRLDLDTSALDNTFLLTTDVAFGRLDYTTCL
ncbi:hypothetical protein [Spirosoma utsteinense]|uniref:Uncharacterized protein n=1 Tax=Spirosoma utsteinense TaxID=2585773 RepID=A0ABR6WCC1_9BACT|nr:hypothetical protein [Spirosoma utsteinense]MBC3788314.1 hypothetical protein [Spirosoma utsteinense]MBC3794220.1 hypothetical protein [Spirosoma utsteinense]